MISRSLSYENMGSQTYRMALTGLVALSEHRDLYLGKPLVPQIDHFIEILPDSCLVTDQKGMVC